MTKKYVKFPLPFEAWKNFKDKQTRMSQTFSQLTGKKRIVPLTRIILESSKNSLFLRDDEVVNIGRRKKRK